TLRVVLGRGKRARAASTPLPAYLPRFAVERGPDTQAGPVVGAGPTLGNLDFTAAGLDALRIQTREGERTRRARPTLRSAVVVRPATRPQRGENIESEEIAAVSSEKDQPGRGRTSPAD